jgi:hypothetical protein
MSQEAFRLADLYLSRAPLRLPPQRLAAIVAPRCGKSERAVRSVAQKNGSHRMLQELRGRVGSMSELSRICLRYGTGVV